MLIEHQGRKEKKQGTGAGKRGAAMPPPGEGSAQWGLEEAACFLELQPDFQVSRGPQRLGDRRGAGLRCPRLGDRTGVGLRCLRLGDRRRGGLQASEAWRQEGGPQAQGPGQAVCSKYLGEVGGQRQGCSCSP